MKKNNLKIAILLPYFNEKYGFKLYKNTEKTLKEYGVGNIELVRVPGALELPFAAQKVIKRSRPNAVIALGVVLKGQTSHYELVCSETFRGLMDIQLKFNTPIIFGILTCKTEKQVKERISRGEEFAEAAIIQSNI
jgi:6,7-dimethyl-8-ribityllumazine synthase